MLDFFKKIFGTENSSATAKERLKLVLLSDHLSLAPDVVERLKADLLEVISRYVDIDHSHADVTFEHREREIAMLANVPILGLRDGRGGPPGRGTSDTSTGVATAGPLRPAPDLAVAAPIAVAVEPPSLAATTIVVADDSASLVDAPSTSQHDAALAMAEPSSPPARSDADAASFEAVAISETADIVESWTEPTHESAEFESATGPADVAPPLFAEAVKPAPAPKRSANGSRRRRRRKPTAPKKAPVQHSLNSLGGMPRPAQA